MSTTETPHLNDLERAFISAARHRLKDSVVTIEHCLDQLEDDDLYWRPCDDLNSICTILLHLCGNVRQWIISGVGGAPDTRDRHREFTDRTRVPRAELLARVHATLDEADAALAALPGDELLRVRRIQGFEIEGLSAILDTVAHFVGHMQEITYVTRMRLEDRYVFRWTPTTAEQGAPVT